MDQATNDPLTATVDDETIARLLQDEFDQEVRMIAAERHRDSEYLPDSNDTTSQSASTDPNSPPSTFGIASARDAMRTKISDLVSYIKTEASKAGKSLQTPTSAVSTISYTESTFERSIPLSPSSPTASSTSGQHFEFSKFLEQMRDRRALPLTKYFRSFLREFTKRNWTVTEQVKIVRDFLDFMAIQLAKNEMFIGATEEQLENSLEGIEKLLMNKLHPYTFSPSASDDQVKDEVLFKKISILQWIELSHLDIHLNHDIADPFLRVSQKELLKVNDYKAPRDKLICILNACKLIFGLLKQTSLSQNADTFLPLLIYVILQANPPQLHSNVQYISRFRNPSKLASESGYYLTNVQGAMSFIESLDHTALSIDKQEFDSRIEQQMRNLEDMEADRRAQKALAALDDRTVLQTPVGTASSTKVTNESSPKDSVSSSQSMITPQLEQLAKKPIELVSRWISQAAASLSLSDPSSPVTPTSHFSDKTTRTSEISKEMHSIDLSHLTAEERAVMSDYELQLAMAMSMSLVEQEERAHGWENVPSHLTHPVVPMDEPGLLSKAIDLINFDEMDEDADDSCTSSNSGGGSAGGGGGEDGVKADVFSVEASAGSMETHQDLVVGSSEHVALNPDLDLDGMDLQITSTSSMPDNNDLDG